MDIAGNKNWMEVKNTIIQSSMRKRNVAKKPKSHLEANHRDNRKTRKFKLFKQTQKDYARSRKITIDQIIIGVRKSRWVGSAKCKRG